jgi:hypothetical protein
MRANLSSLRRRVERIEVNHPQPRHEPLPREDWNVMLERLTADEKDEFHAVLTEIASIADRLRIPADGWTREQWGMLLSEATPQLRDRLAYILDKMVSSGS